LSSNQKATCTNSHRPCCHEVTQCAKDETTGHHDGQIDVSSQKRQGERNLCANDDRRIGCPMSESEQTKHATATNASSESRPVLPSKLTGRNAGYRFLELSIRVS
jgi:hypothetical protein